MCRNVYSTWFEKVYPFRCGLLNEIEVKWEGFLVSDLFFCVKILENEKKSQSSKNNIVLLIYV